jgi:hypothetical protein
MEQGVAQSISARAGSTACQPLLDASHLNIYRENTFRITGLPVDATEREMRRQAATLKHLEEFGAAEDVVTHAYALRPAPSAEQIRAAMQRLKDPELRLIDEFFWFWPKEFGQGSEDPALLALQRGDASTAYGIWGQEALDKESGYVAVHNLAVLYHLVALDWTIVDLSSAVDADREAKIDQYWRFAFDYWEQVATHDSIWESVKARVQNLDDARLTTGFVRRMRTSLPEAFDKINAEAALKFAESGRMDWARKHVIFMNETHQGLDDVEKTAVLVLAPARRRVLQLVQVAKEETNKDPASGKQVAERLIHTCSPIRQLFSLFDDHAAQHNEDLFDAVAEQINSSLVTHGRHTGENSQYVDLLESALLFAAEPGLRDLISKNITIRRANADYAEHKPLFERLVHIRDNHSPAEKHFEIVRREILPAVELVDVGSKAGADLRDLCAQVLREISVTAHNENHDFDTSLAAIQTAVTLAVSEDLRKDLCSDRATLMGNHQDLTKTFVDVRMRGDHVTINNKEFVFNGTRISNDHATGLRFGIYANYTNGIRTYLSYSIGVRSPSAEINMDCKKMLGSEAQAKADYEAILNGAFTHTVPRIIGNLARQMNTGQTVHLGATRMCKDGVFLKSGMLMWAKEELVPWDKIRSFTLEGSVHLVSLGNSKLKASMSCREVWNAVLFEPLAKTMVAAGKRRAGA